MGGGGIVMRLGVRCSVEPGAGDRSQEPGTGARSWGQANQENQENHEWEEEEL